MTNSPFDPNRSPGPPGQHGPGDRRRPHDTTRSIARGLALFLGGFSLLNLLRETLIDRFDANIWWIDLRDLQTWLATPLLLLFSLVLLAFGVFPTMRTGRRRLLLATTSIVGVFVVRDIATFYYLLLEQRIVTDIPLPFSLLMIVALTMVVYVAAFDGRHTERTERRLPILATVVACMITFPLMQIVCFGRTDYRRHADAVVVLGARTYADGRLSISLADRVRKGVELYRKGYVHTVIFSGGPGEGSVHETEAMRALAINMGVSDRDIILDRNGLDTRATARNTVRLARHDRIGRVLAVSNFYHLPRIKMSFQQEGRQVYTVPADDTIWTATPRQIAREILGLWAYYLT